jgi:hypothetical protein
MKPFIIHRGGAEIAEHERRFFPVLLSASSAFSLRLCGAFIKEVDSKV